MATEAWQFHPDVPEMRIRTWPIRFENEERFRSFVDDVLSKPSNWTREAASFACSFSSPAMGQRYVDNLDEFLKGRSPSALRSVYLVAKNPDQNVKSRNLIFVAPGKKTRNQPKRSSGRYFVAYQAYQNQEEMMDIAERGTELEREIELHTVPLNRWQRFRKVPVVERHDQRTLETRQHERRMTLRVWAGSLVIAVVAAWLQGVISPN